jgi:hypothetical protein
MGLSLKYSSQPLDKDGPVLTSQALMEKDKRQRSLRRRTKKIATMRFRRKWAKN